MVMMIPSKERKRQIEEVFEKVEELENGWKVEQRAEMPEQMKEKCMKIRRYLMG